MTEQNPYDQQPNYGAPQPPYGPPPTTQPWPAWLGAPVPPGGVPVPGTRTLASAGDRFLARLIDAAVLLIPAVMVNLIVAQINLFLSAVVLALLFFGYEAVMMLTQDQQTVGKKVMKLRVVSLEHGIRPADNALLARAAVYGLPYAVYCLGSFFWLLNVLWQLWDKPFQQCLHDKAGKTVVVKEA